MTAAQDLFIFDHVLLHQSIYSPDAFLRGDGSVSSGTRYHDGQTWDRDVSATEAGAAVGALAHGALVGRGCLGMVLSLGEVSTYRDDMEWKHLTYRWG
jgi:hypothetical protein